MAAESILWLIAGLISGYAVRTQEIDILQSQLSGLQIQIEKLENFVPPLRSLAEAHGILIGAAVDAKQLKEDAQYAETFSREFNILTPENPMKFESVQPSRNEPGRESLLRKPTCMRG